jgi:hypothetical protein
MACGLALPTVKVFLLNEEKVKIMLDWDLMTAGDILELKG